MIGRSMTLAFILLFIAGFGFSSSGRSSLDGPFMKELNDSIGFDKTAFFVPLICGLSMIISAILAVSPTMKKRGLQTASAIVIVAVIYGIIPLITFARIIISGTGGQNGEIVIVALTTMVCVLYLLVNRKEILRAFGKEEQKLP
jgi:hypothetical protein